MRHTADAPRGVMDYLFVELMLWGREQGYRWFNLGMAPLAGLEARTLAPLWSRAGRARLPPRRALLQLPGPAPVQGQVRSRLGAPLPRLPRRPRPPARPGRRRRADRRGVPRAWWRSRNQRTPDATRCSFAVRLIASGSLGNLFVRATDDTVCSPGGTAANRERQAVDPTAPAAAPTTPDGASTTPGPCCRDERESPAAAFFTSATS